MKDSQDKLDITDALVGQMIQAVCPLVEQETGWDLQPATLRWRALPRERGYEEILLGRLRSAGVAVDETAPRWLLERLIELTIEANLLAAYDPGTQTIFVVRENVDESNLQGLSVILAHELVHRGQHIHYPELFTRADAVIHQIYVEFESGKIGVEEVLEKMGSMQAVMTLIESHAVYIQQRMQQKYYPSAVFEAHFNLFTLLFSVVGKAKTTQYTHGLPEIERAVRDGRVADLYQHI